MKLFGKDTNKLVVEAEEEAMKKLVEYVGKGKKFNVNLNGVSVKMDKVELDVDGRLVFTVKKRSK